jgi:hypothetical protein
MCKENPMNKLSKIGLCVALFSAFSMAPAAEQKADGNSAKPLSATDLLKLDDGRSGKGNLIATTGIRGFSKPANPSAHALIMTIGDYQGNIPKLKGVQFDAASAIDIALRMGVPAANMHLLKDGDLTLAGMRKAFDDLEAQLGGNDQVFIYYSGHGGRQLVQEPEGERCAESLISVDGQAFTDIEMESRLKNLSRKTQKTIVFLDACHSGGVTTRAIGSATPLFSAKSWTPPGLSCTKPTNVLTRNIVLSKTPISGAGANFVYVAAARDSEISLDQPGRGGVATQAWQACLSGAAKDTDGSGGLSAEEVRTCAQDRIDQQLKDVQGYLPHHVSMTGNQSMVLSYLAKPPETPTPVAAAPAPAPAAPVVKPPVPSAPAAPAAFVTAPIATPVAAAKPSAIAALNDIYNSRDDRRLTTLTAAKSSLKIGKDFIDFTLTSREGGHVYLLMVGSDGQTFDLLFPNQLDRNNVIEAGGSLRLPRPAWQLSAEGPPGKDTLLAVVSDSPRDFGLAGLKPSGPFSAIEAVGAKDIQLVTSGAAKPADAQCSDPQATRNLAVKKRCSTGYSAALLTVEEVR